MTLSRKFPVKRASDGKAYVNLGCGTKAHLEWNNIDFSPYARLRKRMWLAALLHKAGLLSDFRWRRLNDVLPGIRLWNLTRGMPYPDNSFDVVYHSHFLEHLNRSDVPDFLWECYRVCKPSGIVRIVVPDLELIIKKYVDAVRKMDAGSKGAQEQHEVALHDLFDQMVRRDPVGTQQQKKWIAKIERILRGGPDKIGELHRWMYDRHSLNRLLSMIGFTAIRCHSFDTSAVPNWDQYGLDRRRDGDEYKKGSLYVEGRKPS